MAVNLFAYGSLMFPPVWNVLIKNHYQTQPASLRGYVRKKVLHDVYPVIVDADKNSIVDGMIYYSVEDTDMARLDLFEGEYYQRQNVCCQTDTGESVTAVTYVFKQQYQHLISAEDWNLHWFEAQGLQQFLADYEGF